MRTVIIWMSIGIAWSYAGEARAFHHHQQYQSPADGRSTVPGSGGLYYTGSRRDLGLRCSHCHVEAEGRIRANVTFSPSVATGWTPGETYRVSVTMTGESKGLSGCAPMLPNRNGIAAMVVGRSGFPAGQVSPDRDTRRCGSSSPPVATDQTTVVFGDCDAAVGAQGNVGTAGSLDTWRFDWRAPSAGAGDVSLWLGVVDGDCGFDSYNDDVYETRVAVAEGGSAALAPPAPAPEAFALGSRRAALPAPPPRVAAGRLRFTARRRRRRRNKRRRGREGSKRPGPRSSSFRSRTCAAAR
jgi:hypothetical protein